MSYKILFFVLLGLVVGYHMGWRSAHITIALECQRLGKFFVGKTTYKCTEIDDE